MKSIIELALRQRILVNLLFVLLMGIGFAVYMRLPVDAWPEVNLDEAWINTYWDGAGAEEVERLVTKKIEDEIEDTNGILRIISQSQANRSFIDVKFDEDLDEETLEAAFNDLRSALDRVADLPESAEEPILQRLTTGEVWPLFSVVVSSPDPDLPELVLRETAHELRKMLREVEGVQRVRYNGYRERELRVLVDRLAARRHGIGMAEIFSALGRTNRSQPAGSIETAARGERASLEESQQTGEIRLKFDDEYDSPEDLEGTVLRVYPGRSPLRLRDIARVEVDFEKRRNISRINGQPAIVLNVAKAADGDTLALRDACGDAIDAFRAEALESIEFHVVGDMSEVVRSRFKVLVENLLLGVVFVSLILFFALGLRNAIIALIGLPFSYVCCFLLFPIFDISINNLTLFGMVLVGGMLVDDAIVVIENIYRHVEQGLPMRRAVFLGASEVAWPVTNACLTTVAAMLPLLLQGGVVGKFFSYIPKVVILALLFSVIQCVTVLPVHYFDFGLRLRKRRRRGDGDGEGARDDAPRETLLERSRRRFFKWSGDLYQRCLAWVLRFRVAFLGIVLGLSLLLIGLVLQIPQDPWISDFNAIMVTIKCDAQYSLEQTDRATELVEAELGELLSEDVLQNYYSISGFSMTTDGVFVVRPYVAFFMVTLVDRPEISADPERIINRLRASLQERIAAQSLVRIDSFEVFPPRDGPPLGKPVSVRIECNDYSRAKEVAEDMKAYLATLEGVESIADNLDLGPREFRFRVDEDRAAALGLFPQDVAVALRLANDGLVVGSYKDRELDEDVDIRVQYARGDRSSPGRLLLTDVRGGTLPASAMDGTGPGLGGKTLLLPMGEVSKVDVVRPNASFYHYDTRRTIQVTADVDGVVATGPAINQQLQRAFADTSSKYPDVRLVYGGEFEENQKSLEQQKQSFLIALVLIYVLLAAQFRSYLQPFVVMAVVPFGVLGVLLGLWLRSQPFTVPTSIAMIGLAGVVVNDSLMLVEFINLRRAEGLPLFEAILTASRQRFRPVLLAAGTTVFNLIPLAFGLGGASRVWTPFAVSIVFGMTVASTMTLFMVPVLYSLLARKRAPEELRPADGEGASSPSSEETETTTRQGVAES